MKKNQQKIKRKLPLRIKKKVIENSLVSSDDEKPIKNKKKVLTEKTKKRC